MKRVKAACICQTLHFMLKENFPHDYAAKMVQDEVAKYKTSLERNRTKYKIISEETQPDGSVIVKIIKQYNASPVGENGCRKEKPRQGDCVRRWVCAAAPGLFRTQRSVVFHAAFGHSDIFDSRLPDTDDVQEIKGTIKPNQPQSIFHKGCSAADALFDIYIAVCLPSVISQKARLT